MDETRLINQIARIYFQLGERKRAADMYDQLLIYIEKMIGSWPGTPHISAKSKEMYFHAHYIYNAYGDAVNREVMRQEMKEYFGIEMPGSLAFPPS